MNTASTAMRNSRWRQKAAQLTTTVLAGLVFIASSGCSPSSDAKTAEVVRVVDGDTLVVLIGSEEETVRLLNVDTPETKDPNKPVECMGLEATSFLKQLTPPGTKVGLDYDVEREDRYGRTLAAVFLADETFVNAEIVKNGFGVPAVFEPNRKYYDQVLAAQGDAEQSQAGLYDDAAECSLPSELDNAVEALEAAAELPVGTTAATAVTAFTALAAALAGAKALNELIEAAQDTAWVTAIAGTKSVALLSRLDRQIVATEKRHSIVGAEVKRLEKAEAAAATKAKAVKEKKVAAAKAEKAHTEAVAKQAREAAAIEAEQEREAAIERERIRNLPPAPAPYAPPAPAPYVPAPAPYIPPVQQDPYPGYTGPRCYAPGGKSWKPCP
ncbi:thermonuclease family protein [Arthrobacter roseus]|uniref:thermonuclease family protein n=1 Tax=Arthrobacter roseus TaxID=136274 RepID=UPI001963AD18|nr:thermonuclease family protein [Arthrobacter roseus]MBM7846928.1 micrococcal nuclease [Arthrobacter roseus]